MGTCTMNEHRLFRSAESLVILCLSTLVTALTGNTELALTINGLSVIQDRFPD